MPRKPANELESIEKDKKTAEKNKTSKASTAAKTSTAKKKTSSTSKSTVAKNSTKTKSTKSTAKAKSTSTKRTTKATSKASTTKGRKSTKKVNVEDITPTTDLTHKIEVIEYYDLPYRYNQTVVKVLAQTPTTLFIYWDVSDTDRLNFVEQYGENFFDYTKPVLVIHNNTMNYSFEVEIDDFANSWYLHVNDSNCEYTVELGRRPKYYNEEKHIDLSNNYLYIASSNVMDSPNDHILFDKNLKTVYFKDVKTNIVTAKDVTSISFLRNMGRIYNLYDLQNAFNENVFVKDNCWQLELRNPSSNSSPTFK